MASTKPRHHFAPLGQPADPSTGAQELKGIVFDMDGTLCEPQNHMFTEMRAALSIQDSPVDILDHIYSLPPEEQASAHAKIQAIERRAMTQQVPQAGLVSLLELLDRFGLRKAICTRNYETPVTHLISTHLPSHLTPFSPIVTRAFQPPKPSPAGILHIAEAWGAAPAQVVMVGDSADDMAAGRGAGALTVLVRSAGKEALEGDARTDVVVGGLGELGGLLLEGGLRGRV